jgi:hypothetical protein
MAVALLGKFVRSAVELLNDYHFEQPNCFYDQLLPRIHRPTLRLRTENHVDTRQYPGPERQDGQLPGKPW